MAFKPTFHKVQRAQSKAAIVIQGLSGSGKTGLALSIAYILADNKWDTVYGLDTENKSLNLFENIQSHMGIPFGKFMKFDLLGVHGYRPSHYIKAKDAAKDAGAKVFVQDSITHAWTGKRGMLDLVARLESANRSVHKFSAWGQPEIIEERDAIYNMIRDPDMHIISTVRMKEKFELITGEGIKSIGVQQIQMPDLKYEPDLVLEMITSGTGTGQAPVARVTKSRYAILQVNEVYEFTSELLEQLRKYLAEGVDPAELLEQQRQDFIATAKAILDESAAKRTLWTALKAQRNLEDVTLKDMTLETLRGMLQAVMN